MTTGIPSTRKPARNLPEALLVIGMVWSIWLAVLVAVYGPWSVLVVVVSELLVLVSLILLVVEVGKPKGVVR